MERELKNERGERGGKEGRFPYLSSPPPPRSSTQAIFRAVFVLCSETARKRLLRRLIGHRLDSYRLKTSFSWTIVCPSFDFGKFPKVLRNNALNSENLRRLHTRFGRSDF